MGFWLFMTAMLLLIPLIMIGFAWYSRKGGPKNINCVFGYRTAMSMKNEDTWAFAHREIGRLWMKWGWILLPLSLIPMLIVWGKGEDAVGTVGTVVLFAQMFPLVGCIFPVEKALKREFNPDGTRKGKAD